MMLNCGLFHMMLFLETWKHKDTKQAYEETFDQRLACFLTSRMRQWLSIWQWSTSLILKVVTDSDSTNTSYARGWTSYRRALFAKLLQSHCLHRNNHLFDDAVPGASIRVVVPRIVNFASNPVNIWYSCNTWAVAWKLCSLHPNWQGKEACIPRCSIL